MPESSIVVPEAEDKWLGPDSGMPSSAWRQRSDAWEYTRFYVKLLALGGADTDESANLAELFRSLRSLETLELYWAGIGQRRVREIRERIESGQFSLALDLIRRAMQGMRGYIGSDFDDEDFIPSDDDESTLDPHKDRHRFEVLVIDHMTENDREVYEREARAFRATTDTFIYELVIVPTADDAIAAILTNPNILAVIMRPGFGDRSTQHLSRDLRETIELAREQARQNPGSTHSDLHSVERVLDLANTLNTVRPELDLYLVAGAHIEDLAGQLTKRFRRVFRREDHLELHLSLLRRISHLYDTPFFYAIQEHARRPAGVFHALPISRGGSVMDSKWIRDLADFYGLNLLLAETSATSGGLDSLLAPVGPIKKAQALAARAFGAKRSYFVTNGTSTANKIVHQALVAPGDIVIVDRNCHKSHHHALMLTGAQVAYLDAYPLNDYAFYGAVPLSRIKQLLLDYRAAGRLDEVKMITLTNCTFDGIVYDPIRVMEECLAIKPDLVFLWDEAWFAFAAFHPVTRLRTAMAGAKYIEDLLRNEDHALKYEEQQKRLFNEDGTPAPDEVWLSERLLPSPQARVRVYATHSTHKTLTALRQGSMIHVYDQDFVRLTEPAFDEAYMTHTSTSPNYQILASLDLGRRQVELEGFELVQRQLDLATSLAQAIARNPLLRRTFRVLTSHDLIPEEYRGDQRPMPHRDGLADMWHSWSQDEFVVDPSRITIEISRTGVDGDTFKHVHLMDRYGIQVNKTSRNTVLFMTNIGTTRSGVAYLVEVLMKLADTFEQERLERGEDPLPDVFEITGTLELPHSLEPTQSPKKAKPETLMPPLPDFSAFADEYRADKQLPDGNMRTAFFKGQNPHEVSYASRTELLAQLDEGKKPVSAGFVTPYPPGFPVLVPGQLISRDVLEFMNALDTREIHGYNPGKGFRIINQD
ncbi:MAG TPA: ornithine decarboxylase [Microbacteriaceae bacterium]|nr:ornithine decarboxylase [Microbacteriaceae bacterium]